MREREIDERKKTRVERGRMGERKGNIIRKQKNTLKFSKNI
jgi:hypothetical protein